MIARVDCEFRAARRNIDQGADHQGAALAGVDPGTLTFFLADLTPHRESHDDIPLRYQQYDHCPANLTSISKCTDVTKTLPNKDGFVVKFIRFKESTSDIGLFRANGTESAKDII